MIENDMLVELIIRALPDMTMDELSELDAAVNAEIQDRYYRELDEYQLPLQFPNDKDD